VKVRLSGNTAVAQQGAGLILLEIRLGIAWHGPSAATETITPVAVEECADALRA
jgi:hypothetical protein